MDDGAGMRRLIGPVVLGVAGVAVLLALGVWQLSRLEVKLAQIAAIEARIAAAPVPVPPRPDPVQDRYLPVIARGTFSGEGVHVLSSRQGAGPGSRVIGVLETDDGRRLLVDRGFLPEARRPAADLTGGPVTVTGNLDWPRDADSYTPPPDLARALWFSRAVEPIAASLGAEPVLIVARSQQGAPVPGLTPAPVGIDIRNDHLEYAVTWFLLALVWAGMSLFLIWRIRRDPP
jgi:surfeit locus 1 family protein